MPRESQTFYNILAEMIAEERNESIEKIKPEMKCKLNFNLLRSQLLCIRDSRCAKQIFKSEVEDVNLVVFDHEFGIEMI